MHLSQAQLCSHGKNTLKKGLSLFLQITHTGRVLLLLRSLPSFFAAAAVIVAVSFGPFVFRGEKSIVFGKISRGGCRFIRRAGGCVIVIISLLRGGCVFFFGVC